MLIVYLNPGTGWQPIDYMVNLAAELFEAEVLILDNEKPNKWRQIEAIGLRREQINAHDACLLVAPCPTDLLSLLLIKNWQKRFRFIAAWIIDSFWLDWIPRIIKFSRPFDHIFITTEEDIPEWKRILKTPTTWLPWGTDALRLGGQEPKRMWDLTRVGRQPPEWEDDSLTEQLCHEKNLHFHGRPKILDTANKNQEMLMALYRQTKFLLAFSNSVNLTNYTHPSREYLTARWVDAIACGAVVAGIPPKEPSINRLLWEGATLDFGSVRRDDGIRVIIEAVNNWGAEQAERNHRRALEQLDWRWRFASIADVFNESPKRLNDELKLLNQRIKQYTH